MEVTAFGEKGVKFLHAIGYWCEPADVLEVSSAYVTCWLKSFAKDATLVKMFEDPHAGMRHSFPCPEHGIPAEARPPDGTRARHGTNMLAIPGIAHEGKTLVGPATPPGIHCHKLGAKSKAQSYTYHTPIGGGIFIAPLVPLRVRNPKNVCVDQWLVQPDECWVEMVHFRVVSFDGLEAGREWLIAGWTAPFTISEYIP